VFRSVRSRLTFWYCGVLAVVLASFSAVSYLRLARTVRAETDASLSETAREFVAAFPEDESAEADSSARDVALDFRLSDRSLMILRPDGSVVATSRSREIDRTALAEIERRIERGTRGLFTIERGDLSPVRVLASQLSVVSRPFVVVVARSLRDQRSRLEAIATILLLGIPMSLMIAGAGGYLLARYSLAPVLRMSRNAERIGASNLAERIEVANPIDELGILAGTLNDLLTRLEVAFALQRRFMADASHELGTPIAIIQGEADIALSRSARTADEYRDAFRVIQATARKLTQIVKDLFLLSRGDAGGYPIRPVRFYFDETVAACTRALRTTADARGVTIRTDPMPEILVLADEELIHRLVLNLLDNAVKYTRSGAFVDVSVERADGICTLRVRDAGPGVAPNDQDRLFERFFRARHADEDPDLGQGGGAGLGLAIARWIARMHGGEVHLEQSSASGSTFSAELRIDAPDSA
jgi:two-component system OmpR family sensor kinase